jgi:hypothetical protein
MVDTPWIITGLTGRRTRYYCPTYLQILQLVDSSYANSCTTLLLLIPFKLSCCVHDASFMNLYWSSILYESYFLIICFAMFTISYARNLVSVRNSGYLGCLKYIYFLFLWCVISKLILVVHCCRLHISESIRREPCACCSFTVDESIRRELCSCFSLSLLQVVDSCHMLMTRVQNRVYAIIVVRT